MATVNFSVDQYKVDHEIYTWTPLTTTNADGQPTGYAGSGQRTIQITGTWGVGGACIVEGSLDGGATWFQLNDLGGTAISLTANGLKGVREDVPLIRPRVTGGDGTTSLTAIISIRRSTLS